MYGFLWPGVNRLRQTKIIYSVSESNVLIAFVHPTTSTEINYQLFYIGRKDISHWDVISDYSHCQHLQFKYPISLEFQLLQFASNDCFSLTFLHISYFTRESKIFFLFCVGRKCIYEAQPTKRHIHNKKCSTIF